MDAGAAAGEVFMFEKAFHGGPRYLAWMMGLLAVVCAGAWSYRVQMRTGLAVTGLSRDVAWGLYISQFTFFVGVAASAVMVVLPYYLHDYKLFAPVIVLGEMLALTAVVICGLFIVVDMGQPSRVLNLLLYPSPRSMMFWDMLALAGYLLLNLVIARVTLEAERNDLEPSRWIRPVILLSIPWAVSIHTVTAFLYCGLPGRSLWLTAILAPRFLASAFAAGPALLVVLCLIARRLDGGRTAESLAIGRQAVEKVAIIVAYATAVNLFFVAVELFTVFYSQVPEHATHARYLYAGLAGHTTLVPWSWAAAILLVIGLTMLVEPRTRTREGTLGVACAAVFAGLWIDKGLVLIVAGFVPSPLGAIIDYIPTRPEISITTGIWALGAMLVTALFKITVEIRAARR